MSLEATSETPTPPPTTIEVPTHVQPVNPPGQTVVKDEQCSVLELSKLILKEYGYVKKANKLVAKIGRKSIASAIACGDFANKTKEHGKETGEIPHGKWEKWLEELFGNKSAARSVQKWMTLATFAKEHPNEIGNCTSLSDAEVVCGVRTPPKPIDRDNPPADNNGETTPLPAIILEEIKRSFEHIQQQYDVLTAVDPELNGFLLKGYDNDFPLLLQMWQSSLSDAFAYFGLEGISNVCVRCGHVRRWDDFDDDDDGVNGVPSNEVFVPIMAYYPQSHQQRFNLWCQECEATCRIKLPDVKELSDNVNELKFSDITDEKKRAKAYTLAKKVDQLKHYKVDDRKLIADAEAIEWIPSFDLDNEGQAIAFINELSPRTVFADTPKERQRWDIYRHFVSGAPYNALVGRQIKFFVVDGKEKVLGIGAISSDMMSLDERDTFIGWTLEQRHEENGKLGCIANGSVIVPTGLFGSNFFGGKLIASLTTCQVLRDKWKELYGDTLVGLSTTSLFGVPSMYDKVDEWKRLGKTKGAVPIEPSIELFEKWRQFLSETRTHEYKQILESSTNQKARILTAIYRAAGISDFEHGIARGLYFAEVYENTKDFLCGRINEGTLKLKPLYAETVEQITDRWRKTAIKRYQKLKQENRLRTARRSYGGQVGIEDMTDSE